MHPMSGPIILSDCIREVRSEGEVIEQSTVGHGLVLLHLVTAGTKNCSTIA